MTYKGVAKALGTHHRVVARALRESPTDVPWWRVVNEGWQLNRYDKIPPDGRGRSDHRRIAFLSAPRSGRTGSG